MTPSAAKQKNEGGNGDKVKDRYIRRLEAQVRDLQKRLMELTNGYESAASSGNSTVVEMDTGSSDTMEEDDDGTWRKVKRKSKKQRKETGDKDNQLNPIQIKAKQDKKIPKEAEKIELKVTQKEAATNNKEENGVKMAREAKKGYKPPPITVAIPNNQSKELKKAISRKLDNENTTMRLSKEEVKVQCVSREDFDKVTELLKENKVNHFSATPKDEKSLYP